MLVFNTLQVGTILTIVGKLSQMDGLCHKLCFQQYTAVGEKGATLKKSSISSLRRLEFLKLRKQNSSAGSVVTLLNFKRRALLDCNRGSSLLWQSVWKCKSLWKQKFGWQRSKAKYSYDLRSYTLNFDDDFFNDSFSHHGSH